MHPFVSAVADAARTQAAVAIIRAAAMNPQAERVTVQIFADAAIDAVAHARPTPGPDVPLDITTRADLYAFERIGELEAEGLSRSDAAQEVAAEVIEWEQSVSIRDRTVTARCWLPLDNLSLPRVVHRLAHAETESELLRAMEAHCQRLAAADLAAKGMPAVYVVPMRLLTDSPRLTLNACIAPHYDLTLRHLIGKRWRGRGVAMLLDTCRLQSLLDSSDGWITGTIRESAMALAVHELCHPLADGLPSVDLTPDEAAAGLANTLAWVETPPPERGYLQEPWNSHGAKFIRAVLHAAHRSGRIGVPLNPSTVFESAWHHLSPMNAYAAAIGDEPQALEDLTFSEILARTPPPAFSRLWTDDDLAWLKEEVATRKPATAETSEPHTIAADADEKRQRRKGRAGR